jgi:GNAT superfamily N-acetyltransferase
MAGKDLEQVEAIYRAALTPGYVSFSEIREGKGTPTALAPDAMAIFSRDLRANLDSPSHGCFVFGEAEIYGFLLASLHPTPAGFTECWLDDGCIDPKRQYKGIGKALTKHGVAWAKANGARFVFIESSVGNGRAHSVAEKLGFKPLAIVLAMDLT